MHRSRRRILSRVALTALLTLVIVAGPVHAGTGPSRSPGPIVDGDHPGRLSFSGGTALTDEPPFGVAGDPEITRDGRPMCVGSRATDFDPSGTTEALQRPPQAPAG